MNAVDRAKRIRQIIRDITDATVVVDENTLIDDLGCDDLDHLEIAMAIEEAFAIEIPDAVFENVNTVGDLIAAVEGCIPAETVQ